MTPTASDSWAWVEGRVVALAHARVPLMDHGFLYGDSVYEAIRTWRGRPFLINEHLARLRHSAAGLSIPMPEGIAPAVEETLARSGTGPGERLLRVIVTRGVGPLGYALDPLQQPTLVVISQPVPRHPGRFYTDGVRLALVSVRRSPQDSLDPALKTSNLLNLRLAFMEARRRGADDALMLNHQGDVAEASGSNLFVVRAGAVCTPPLAAGILEGITRDFVMGLARQAGIPACERSITLDDLRAADEVFLTSTTRSVMPATRLDDAVLGDGRPGPVTLRLTRAFEEATGCPLVGG